MTAFLKKTNVSRMLSTPTVTQVTGVHILGCSTVIPEQVTVAEPLVFLPYNVIVVDIVSVQPLEYIQIKSKTCRCFTSGEKKREFLCHEMLKLNFLNPSEKYLSVISPTRKCVKYYTIKIIWAMLEVYLNVYILFLYIEFGVLKGYFIF